MCIDYGGFVVGVKWRCVDCDGFGLMAEMYNNMGPQPGMPRPPGNPEPGPFGNPFTGAGSGFIRGGLGAYGERILGSSSEYVQSNVSELFLITYRM